MEKDELYKALEELNKEKNELKYSKEYRLGNAIKENLSLIFKCKFNRFLRNISNKKAKIKIQKKYCNIVEIKDYSEQDIDYKKAKIAIYTCVIGNYDNIQKPLVTFENVDYYLLTDNISKYEVYKKWYIIKEIPKDIIEKGNIEGNRYVKFHPHEYFKNYDYTIYIDGNVRIISDVRTFIKRCTKKTGLAMHRHRERNDIYDEAEVCKLLKRGNTKKIDEQMLKYKNEKFPKNFGMNEATIIVCNLNNEKSMILLDEWYKEFIRSKSLRDQLAWPYVLWKNNYTISDIGYLGNNIYKNYKVEMVKHK